MIPSSSPLGRDKNAEALIADLFRAYAWNVLREEKSETIRPDLVVRRRRQCYVIEVKSLSEGRPDRVIPMLSQAILQAQSYALNVKNAQALAVIYVDSASLYLPKQIEAFVEKYAPNVAVGLVSGDGLRYFRGEGLEEINAEPTELRWHGSPPQAQPANIFSDLNQWMLKVLLANEIPDHLLQAPRKKYRSGSELAAAAGVSVMSASRFLQQLRTEGYLAETSRYLILVRRQELFNRWRSATIRSVSELPMRFLIRGSVQKQLRSLLTSNRDESCMALFGAAEALGLGHVSGVLPYVYVPKLPRPGDKKWRNLAITSPSEMPDLIVRQALSPKSVFRGAVHQDGLLVSDVIQVWLDVANHPSRGEEQAKLIYENILRPIIGG